MSSEYGMYKQFKSLETYADQSVILHTYIFNISLFHRRNVHFQQARAMLLYFASEKRLQVTNKWALWSLTGIPVTCSSKDNTEIVTPYNKKEKLGC